VKFAITGGGGTELHTGETFHFMVTVTNESHLDMKNVKVRVNGTEFADVAFKSGSFGNSADSKPFDLDAGKDYTTDYFRGKAKKITNGKKDIATAQISSWDASFDHILMDHSGEGTVEGKLKQEIKLQ